MTAGRTSPGRLDSAHVLRPARHPDTFKQATLGAGSTSVNLWTPASGRKARILRYGFEVTGDANKGAAGVLTLSLYDGGSGGVQTPFVHSFAVPAAAGTGGTLLAKEIDLGELGYLSAAADNLITAVLTGALTGGNIRFRVAGVEE